MSDRLKCNPRFCPRCAVPWAWPEEGSQGSCTTCGIQFQVYWADNLGGILENLQMEGKGDTHTVIVVRRVALDGGEEGRGSEVWGHAVFYWPTQGDEWEPKFDLSRNYVRAGGEADAPFTEYHLGHDRAPFKHRDHRVTIIPDDWQTG